MRTVEEIRLVRLQALVAEAGSIANLNRAAGRNERDATISQILTRWPGKSGKPKELGSAMARELELAMSKPRGWMDNDPDLVIAAWPFASVSPAQYSGLSSMDQAKIEERVLVLVDLGEGAIPQ